MKSLIRTQSPSVPAENAPQVATVVDEKVAQCCAKVSKTVAGCHD
jgi:hypothetical protein